jgi:hypothetical protein
VNRPKLLDLPHGYQVIIDAADEPLVRILTLYRGINGYVYFSVWRDGKSHPRTLHGFLMQPPKGAHVDHINGDKLDNRRVNLRLVSPQLNQVNRKRLNRNNTSGMRGVAYRPDLSRTKPWHAQITADRRNRYLGLFATREDAIAARRQAELDLFGELCP